MKMSESIRFYRENAGMRQLDLGQHLGVSAQAVSKWELGKAEPDRECIEKMCNLFGIDSDTLLGISLPSFSEITKSLHRPSVEPSEDEQQLLSLYRQLNASGRDKLMDYARDLSENDRYTKDTQSKAT